MSGEESRAQAVRRHARAFGRGLVRAGWAHSTRAPLPGLAEAIRAALGETDYLEDWAFERAARHEAARLERAQTSRARARA